MGENVLEITMSFDLIPYLMNSQTEVMGVVVRRCVPWKEVEPLELIFNVGMVVGTVPMNVCVGYERSKPFCGHGFPSLLYHFDELFWNEIGNA